MRTAILLGSLIIAEAIRPGIDELPGGTFVAFWFLVAVIADMLDLVRLVYQVWNV